MNAKERHRIKIIEYLGNPDNDFPNRETIASTVLEISKQALYKHFTLDELQEIEQEGLELRRTKYAAHLAQIDISLLKEAKKGKTDSAKLAYQRFENWSEKHNHEVTGKDGGPIEAEFTVNFIKTKES
jgi:hypothetical protein